ncbi:MAG: phosphatase PAP2 family protein [Acidobacteria bacterium]|nr:phosphatase PAP2 family protein [Acidobacteriota bacterium]
MDSLIVFVALYFLYLSVLLVVLYWLRSTRTTKIEMGFRLVVGGLLALALARIGGHLYYNPRPFVTDHVKPLFAHAADNGFPSDHALLASFLGFTLLRYSRNLGGILLVNAVLIGAARVAAHVHHPLDILGSFVFSAIAVVATSWLATNDRVANIWRR